MHKDKTHFGYEEVAAEKKVAKVAEVFANVAHKYDLMNDLMSAGLHRLWKRKCVSYANINAQTKALDLASGTADIALLISEKICAQGGNSNQIVISDINPKMLDLGENKLNAKGFTPQKVVADAESLPFADNSFDLITIGFGLRNVTNKEKALTEMFRVLSPNGQLIILEFSHINVLFARIYDFYSFYCIPLLGKLITGDGASYRYLVESIRVHPSQEQLKEIIINQGFAKVNYFNLVWGAVAIHIGYKN